MSLVATPHGSKIDRQIERQMKYDRLFKVISTKPVRNLPSVTAGLGQPVILFPRCYVVSLHDVERNIKRKIIMESSNKISNVKSGTK